jgi:predicted nucleic acid-binding Zn ribbon protein
MSADPLRECPQCGGEVRRLIGGGMGVIFKGSGFYVTDNRSSSNGAEKKTAAKEGEAATTEGNSDSSGTAEKKSGAAEKPETGSTSRANGEKVGSGKKKE